MSIDDLKTVERLGKIVARLTSNPDLREDLMQEALIHLWQVQEQQPGQSESWYFQSCRYHLQHFLVAGRSVDSHKRSFANVRRAPDGAEGGDSFDIDETVESDDPILSTVCVRDMIDSMSPWLSVREQAVLHYLADGWRTREIARRLNVSHPTIIKHRRKIGAMVNQLIAGPSDGGVFPEGQRQFLTTRRNGHDASLQARVKATGLSKPTRSQNPFVPRPLRGNSRRSFSRTI